MPDDSARLGSDVKLPRDVDNGGAIASIGADTEPPNEAEAGPETTAAIRLSLSKFLKGKEKEWDAVSKRQGPLRLLDLPLDVLHLVVKEVCEGNFSRRSCPLAFSDVKAIPDHPHE